MRRGLIGLSLALALAQPASAGRFVKGTRLGTGQATVTWIDPAFDGDAAEPALAIADLSHCIVFYGSTSGGPYTAQSGSIAAGVQTYTTPATLAAGTWYFAVRCYDTSGNPSFYSIEGSKTI